MTAPAAMPGTEDVARAIASFRKHIRPDSLSPDILPSEMAQASAVLALFAPILAEKEREQANHFRDRALVDRGASEPVFWKDRALAAEAALAAACRLLALAKDEIIRTADDLSMHSPAVRLVEEIAAHIGQPAINSRAVVAAAIRAQGSR